MIEREVRLRACANRDFVLRGELARARNKVGMQVRIERVGQAQSQSLGDANVLVNVAFGINDDGLSRLFGGDEVRRVAQIFVNEGFNEHVSFSLL